MARRSGLNPSSDLIAGASLGELPISLRVRAETSVQYDTNDEAAGVPNRLGGGPVVALHDVAQVF